MMASSSNLIELIASYVKLDLFSKRLWECNVTSGGRGGSLSFLGHQLTSNWHPYMYVSLNETSAMSLQCSNYISHVCSYLTALSDHMQTY